MTLRTKNSDRAAGRARRGTIGLGDLLRSLKGLDTRDPATAERIARSLGFTGIEANPVEETQGVSGAAPRPRVSKKPAPENLPHRSGLPPVTPPVDLPAEILETEMTPIESMGPPSAPPEWLDKGPLLGDRRLPSVPRAKLFPERSAKGVLTAAVATRRAGIAPDIARLVQGLVRGRVLARFPYRPRPSVHRGVQLLMDTSDAMTPFLEDLDDLARELVSVVGKNATELYEFQGDPNTAVRWTEGFNDVPWRTVPGRPVVLATDFGIGAQAAAHDRATPRAWSRFERQTREAGVPVIAFVPYGRARWPQALSRRIRLVHWDHRTRASHIKKLFGVGHEVGP